MSLLDLDAYLQRIGHTGPRTPTRDTLAAVHGAHAQAIAFENLDPLLGRPVRLDLPSLQRKLVSGGRGGFCYEHNLLLGAALRALGFAVTDLAARVHWNVAPGIVRPRTHMLLRVDLGPTRYLVDTGFGGRTLTAPLQLDLPGAQGTPHGAFRLLRDDDGFVLQAGVDGAWKALYSFDLQPQVLADYELTSWYLCHHPESQFQLALVAARPVADGRWTLRDRQLSFHHLDGSTDVQTLSTVAALRTALETRFGIALSDLPGLDARLAEVAALRA